MNQKVKRILLCLLLVFCLGATPSSNTFAMAYSMPSMPKWSESKLKQYAEDNILYFDDSFDCGEYYDENGNFITNPGDDEDITIDNTGDVWDGHCDNVNSYNNWLNTHVETIISIANENQLPWEGIMAQTIQESSGGKKEICKFNPLGLKAKKGWPSCDKKGHAKFESYKEAFNYYVNNIIPVREAKGKFPNDPYKYIHYLQHDATHHYAESKTYTDHTSAKVCGIQKWAEENGYQTSSKTYYDYPNGLASSSTTTTTPTSTPSENSAKKSKSTYEDCKPRQRENPSTPDNPPSDGSVSTLQALVKEWAWPTYANPKTDKRPAYEAIIAKSAYKGDGCHGGGVDCGAFVYNLMHESGWDPNYPANGTSSQLTYLKSHWQRLGNGADIPEDQLQPGDVAIRDGHVFIYVGNIPGFSSHTASASQCKRAPMAGREFAAGKRYLNNFTWYRKK